ncbi:MAG: outer membrane lipoprotein carrier protein LolA [Urechidicola sp.]|nr:outer membrane lipoprotein carrier protein LolA [Urechidicola sp.]
MKKYLFLLFITYTTIGFSQGAKALLDEVADKVKSYDNIYIEFEHKIDNEEADIHQANNGNATLKDDLYHFEYLGVEQFFDGAKIYMIVHEDEEVVIKQPNSEDETTLTPSRMLTFYESGFTYEMDIVQKVKGKKMQFVKLTPTDTESELKHVLVAINKKTKHIYRVIETGKDGTVTTYTIGKFHTNQAISDSLFTFDRKFFEENNYYISEPK